MEDDEAFDCEDATVNMRDSLEASARPEKQ